MHNLLTSEQMMVISSLWKYEFVFQSDLQVALSSSVLLLSVLLGLISPPEQLCSLENSNHSPASAFGLIRNAHFGVAAL